MKKRKKEAKGQMSLFDQPEFTVKAAPPAQIKSFQVIKYDPKALEVLPAKSGNVQHSDTPQQENKMSETQSTAEVQLDKAPQAADVPECKEAKRIALELPKKKSDTKKVKEKPFFNRTKNKNSNINDLRHLSEI